MPTSSATNLLQAGILWGPSLKIPSWQSLAQFSAMLMADQIRRALRAPSVGDSMAQASFQQGREPNHTFHQAQQLNDPAN